MPRHEALQPGLLLCGLPGSVHIHSSSTCTWFTSQPRACNSSKPYLFVITAIRYKAELLV